MSTSPLLPLEHEWHRGRSAAAGGRARPPPLLAAGLEIEAGPEGRRLVHGGLAIIFGHFPPTFADLIGLARSRLHLQPGQVKELEPVLGARVLALWARLPLRGVDCYLEYDRATDHAAAWLIGPDGQAAEPLATDPPDAGLDGEFLAGVVLHGPATWHGAAGLERLRERFGPQPLLVAAQIAEAIEQGRDPRAALDLARVRWPRLSADDETPWCDLVERELPWACVQLGRLALRLGLPRAARLLLAAANGTDAGAPAWLDLGEVSERLGDLAEAESAYARLAAARPSDQDAWRRLLLARLRIGHLQVADETAKRFRAAGGADADLAAALLAGPVRETLPLRHRGWVATWIAARLAGPLLAAHPLEALAYEAGCARLPDPQPLIAECRRVADDAALAFADVGPPEQARERGEAVALLCLLALPLLAPRHAGDRDLDQEQAREILLQAIAQWHELSQHAPMRWASPPAWLDGICRLAITVAL